MSLPPTPRAGPEPSWDVVSASQDKSRLCLGPGLPSDVLNRGLGHPPPALGLESRTPGLGSRSAPHLWMRKGEFLWRTRDSCPQGKNFTLAVGGQGWSHSSWASEPVWGQTQGPAHPGGQRERSWQTAKDNKKAGGDRVVGGDEGVTKVST